jgi:hypothetical protein
MHLATTFSDNSHDLGMWDCGLDLKCPLVESLSDDEMSMQVSADREF